MKSKTILSQELRNEKLAADPTCRRCGITKTVDDFPKKAVDYACNDCRKKYAIELYHKQRSKLSEKELASLKDKINERQNKRRAKTIEKMSAKERDAFYEKLNRGNTERRYAVRHEVYMAYGGYICACCGETEKSFLSIDHIYNDGAKHKRENNLKTGEQMYRWLKRNNFPDGFQILCMNCQWGKRNNNGICPHKSVKVQRLSREGVEPSGSKRNTSQEDDDIVCSA